MIKLLARAFRGMFSLFVLEYKHVNVFVCFLFFEKKRDSVCESVCVGVSVLRNIIVIKIIAVGGYHKNSNRVVFLLFYTQIMQSVLCVCLFVRLFALKAISRRVFIKMLFCDKCFLVTHPLSCHHHLYIYIYLVFFFVFSALVMRWMEWLPALNFPIIPCVCCMCWCRFYRVLLLLTSVSTLSQRKFLVEG